MGRCLSPIRRVLAKSVVAADSDSATSRHLWFPKRFQGAPAAQPCSPSPSPQTATRGRRQFVRLRDSRGRPAPSPAAARPRPGRRARAAPRESLTCLAVTSARSSPISSTRGASPMPGRCPSLARRRASSIRSSGCQPRRVHAAAIARRCAAVAPSAAPRLPYSRDCLLYVTANTGARQAQPALLRGMQTAPARTRAASILRVTAGLTVCSATLRFPVNQAEVGPVAAGLADIPGTTDRARTSRAMDPLTRLRSPPSTRTIKPNPAPTWTQWADWARAHMKNASPLNGDRRASTRRCKSGRARSRIAPGPFPFVQIREHRRWDIDGGRLAAAESGQTLRFSRKERRMCAAGSCPEGRSVYTSCRADHGARLGRNQARRLYGDRRKAEAGKFPGLADESATGSVNLWSRAVALRRAPAPDTQALRVARRSHSPPFCGHRCRQMNRENMSEREWLAERFEEEHRRLRAVANRMLGSLNEADDAVQEAWAPAQPAGRVSVSRTTSSARPTESASSASCSGSVPSARSTTGSGTCGPSGSSRRLARARNMLSETRATTVVSQAPRFSTALASVRLRRIHAYLDGVVCLAERAQHPVSHRSQTAALLLEPLRQPLALIHRSRSSLASGHRDRPGRAGQ
jgi:hypothetical protein